MAVACWSQESGPITCQHASHWSCMLKPGVGTLYFLPKMDNWFFTPSQLRKSVTECFTIQDILNAQLQCQLFHCFDMPSYKGSIFLYRRVATIVFWLCTIECHYSALSLHSLIFTSPCFWLHSPAHVGLTGPILLKHVYPCPDHVGPTGPILLKRQKHAYPCPDHVGPTGPILFT